MVYGACSPFDMWVHTKCMLCTGPGSILCQGGKIALLFPLEHHCLLTKGVVWGCSTGQIEKNPLNTRSCPITSDSLTPQLCLSELSWAEAGCTKCSCLLLPETKVLAERTGNYSGCKKADNIREVCDTRAWEDETEEEESFQQHRRDTGFERRLKT